MQSFPQLTDGVVTVRPLRADDVSSMYEAVCESLADLKPWMSWAHDDYERKETRDWVTVAQARWTDGTYYGFAIIDAHRHIFLGSCSISHIHPLYHFCNLGYWVRATQRGHGFAGRAARLTARFAFERVSLIRAEIVIATENVASQRVADKMGAHREGILFNRMVIRDKIRDAVMYSLLPSDFELAPRL